MLFGLSLMLACGVCRFCPGSAPVDVVVVTCSYHVPRAWTVASLVLGYAGLSFHVAEAHLD